MDRLVLFGFFTALMLYATSRHVAQLRRGELRGDPWPFQIVTNRKRTPRRFAVLKVVVNVCLIAMWAGWLVLLLAVIRGLT